MNKLPKTLKEDLDLGWSIQVYSSDRRLLCSLDPSHGWSFLLGIVLGVIVSVGYIQSISVEPTHPASTEELPQENHPPLEID